MKFQPIKKIDCHVHVSNSIKKSVINGMPIWTTQQMFEVYDLFKIEKGIVLPGSAKDSDMTNDEAYALSMKYPERITWLCNIEPDGTEYTFNTIKRYKEMGARGVGEFSSSLRLDDPKILHLLECCEILEMPFLFHMSPNLDKYYGVFDFEGLPLLENILKKYPALKVIGHSQPFWFEMSTHGDSVTPEERNSFPAGRITEGRLQELFRKYPNLYGDLSANSAGNALMRDPDYAVSFLDEFQDRLMYGTDMVNSSFIYPLGQWLDIMVRQRRISEVVYLKICRENAERIYKL